MKVRLNFLDHDIEVKNDSVFSVECENKIYFYRIVGIINALANGYLDEALEIYDQENEVDCSNKVEVIIDYFNFDFSNKKYQAKLIDMLNHVIDSEDISRFNNEFKKIRKLVEKNLGKLDLPIVIQKDFELDSFIKVLKLSIRENKSLLDNLLLIIDIEKTFHLNYFYVFVNLKSYLSHTEINELYKYALYNQVSILMLDNDTYGTCLDNEHKIIIDENLNEFMLQ
ncbi:MAG TPA: type II-A CRISPR-associated protein Csn2 [Candidatus Scybalousia intestinigallinarum]|nr:type II-A CRISPR-associated protein Csn2 [Candidatus Scybalousia intestinigallinarum]